MPVTSRVARTRLAAAIATGRVEDLQKAIADAKAAGLPDEELEEAQHLLKRKHNVLEARQKAAEWEREAAKRKAAKASLRAAISGRELQDLKDALAACLDCGVLTKARANEIYNTWVSAHRKSLVNMQSYAQAAAQRKAEEEAARRAQEDAELLARKEAAERKVREEAEQRAKALAERKAAQEAEQRAAEEQMRRLKSEQDREKVRAQQRKEEAERRELEAREKKEQELAAKRAMAQKKLEEEAARRAQEEVAERARREAAELKAAQDAERRIKAEAERKAKEEAAQRAKEEAERKARDEAERLAKLEAERRVKQEEAARRAREEAEHKAKEEAERRAKAEAERKAKQEEAIRKAREEAEQKAKQEAERELRAASERKARQAREEEERKKKAEAEKKAKQAREEAERKAKAEAEKEVREAAEREARMAAERKAKQEEAARRAKLDAEQKAKEDMERKAKAEADFKIKQEAARKAKEEADKKAKEEADRRKAQAKESAERAAREEAERKAQAESAARHEVEKHALDNALLKVSISANFRPPAQPAKGPPPKSPYGRPNSKLKVPEPGHSPRAGLMSVMAVQRMSISAQIAKVIVVDMGNMMCRVGWAHEAQPKFLGVSWDLTSLLETARWQLHLKEVNEYRRHPVIITEPPLPDSTQREGAVEVVLQSLNCPFLCMASTPVLALRASGRRSGLVVDLGQSSSIVTPVYEGFVVRHAVQDFKKITGNSLDDFVCSLLNKHVRMNMYGSKQKEIGQEVKERHCRVAFHFESELQDIKNGTDKKTYADYQFPPEPGSMETVGKHVELREELILGPEVIFQPKLLGDPKARGLADIVMDAIWACDPHIRKLLVRNIYLAGRGTMFRGFKDRLAKELAGRLPSVFDLNIQVAEGRDQNLSAYIGACKMATEPTFHCLSLDKDEFREYGPKRIHWVS